MTIPASGPVSLSEIRDELAPGTSNPISLGSYYNTPSLYGNKVPFVPSSGSLAMSNFRGRFHAVETSDPYWSNVVNLVPGYDNFDKKTGTPLEQLRYDYGWRTTTDLSLAYQTTKPIYGIEVSDTSIGPQLGVRLGRETNNITKACRVQQDLNISGPFTIEFMVYMHRLGFSQYTRDTFLSTTENGDYSDSQFVIFRYEGYSQPFLGFKGITCGGNVTSSSEYKRRYPNLPHDVTDGSNFKIGQWYHLAWARDASNNVRFFQDGIHTQTANMSGVLYGRAILGGLTWHPWDNGPWTCDATIRQYRVTNACRYTTNYTPYLYQKGTY